MGKETALTLALAMLWIGGTARADHEERACDLTSQATRKACKNEAQDDYWIAVGICANLSDHDGREECLAEASSSLAETNQECREQFEAREDLCADLGQAPYDPVIDPADFLSPEETAANPNPYWPLIPGRTWVYRGEGQTTTVTVTERTKKILGVTTTVVKDVVIDDQGGNVIEDTDDWLAQDVDGNVWYFGEFTKSFVEGGGFSLEGSWTAGVEGGKPGIIMKAVPRVGDIYRQEFAPGNVEDAGRVTSTNGSETVPAASCNGDCVVTREFTPIEPGVEANKYYAPGVGTILEVELATNERVELVSVTDR